MGFQPHDSECLIMRFACMALSAVNPSQGVKLNLFQKLKNF